MKTLSTIIVAALIAPAAHAQFSIDWYTVDCGGGTSFDATFSLTGTIGQADAAPPTGSGPECDGGFWNFPGAACYPNCDASSIAPILNVNDFQCFLNRFASADPSANCDHSTTSPTLNVNDFQCFLNAFAAGCS